MFGFTEKYRCRLLGAIGMLSVLAGCGMGLYDRDPYPIEIPVDSGIDLGGDAGGDAGLDLGNDVEIGASCNEEYPSSTQKFNSERGELLLCGVRLVLATKTFSTETNVKLIRVSKNGFHENSGTKAMGPIFSISKTNAAGQPVDWNQSARVEFTFQPFDPTIAIERLQLAYFDPLARIWIAIVPTTYDPKTGVLSAPMNELKVDPLEFSAFVKCDSSFACPKDQSCSRSTICQ